MKARIFEVKRFAIHDGDGVRTTIFFKGCPLKCKWCHNPEGLNYNAELAFYSDKCINCGECVKACPNKAHYLKEGKHIFDRKQCVSCGKCVEVCLSSALNFYGKDVSLEDLLVEVLKDQEFFKLSGGGITLSGGECLLQSDFCARLLERLKAKGINTAVDTCGYVSKEVIDKVLPYTDVFLYDVKAFDESVHEQGTGVKNDIILKNLEYIDRLNKQTEVRIPFVPNYTHTQIRNVAQFLANLKNLKGVRVLPYHNYAKSKYLALGLENTLIDTLPVQEEIEEAITVLKEYGLTILG